MVDESNVNQIQITKQKEMLYELELKNSIYTKKHCYPHVHETEFNKENNKLSDRIIMECPNMDCTKRIR